MEGESENPFFKSESAVDKSSGRLGKIAFFAVTVIMLIIHDLRILFFISLRMLQ